MENNAKNMENNRQIMLNTQIIADEFTEASLKFKEQVANGIPNLRTLRVFSKGQELSEDTLYFVPNSIKDAFPSDEYCYICCSDLNGKAPHICNIDKDEVTVLDMLMSIFQKYRDFETECNNALLNNSSISDLCKIASKLFNNPIYIHDRNFSVLGISEIIPGMLEFEKNQATGGLQIPLWLVDQFKFDPDYQRTLEQTRASIWGKDQYPHNIRSLFVNIREGSLYFGRCLVNEINHTFKPGEFRILEVFAEYVKEIIRRSQVSHNALYTRYEDIFRKLSDGDESIDVSDLSTFLKVRKWDVNDEYVCLVFQTQDERLSIRSESAIRATLLTEFKESFDFFNNQNLYLVINMTKMKMKITAIRNAIAALVRDSYMYCGISNRIAGLMNITKGFLEAKITLEYVKKNSSKWIQVFVDIALDYALENINVPLDTQLLIAPQLEKLEAHDTEFGTEYYKTLKCYLVNERDISKTSKELVIHRTTLTHRIEQMKKLITLDLDDAERRLHLLVSIKLYEKS